MSFTKPVSLQNLEGGIAMAETKSVELLATGPYEAHVQHSRSWSNGIYMTLVAPALKGWVEFGSDNPYGVAVCAAAQATGKPVFITYESFDPNWGNGAGHFFGVKAALAKESF
jgi:hypothetical protein